MDSRVSGFPFRLPKRRIPFRNQHQSIWMACRSLVVPEMKPHSLHSFREGTMTLCVGRWRAHNDAATPSMIREDVEGHSPEEENEGTRLLTRFRHWLPQVLSMIWFTLALRKAFSCRPSSLIRLTGVFASNLLKSGVLSLFGLLLPLWNKRVFFLFFFFGHVWNFVFYGRHSE